MTIDLRQFQQTNKKAVIWSIFFVLLYLVRKLFGLVLLTYILCFIFNNIVGFMGRRAPFPRRLRLVVLYAVFVSTVVAGLAGVMPRMAAETTIFIHQLPASLDTLHGKLEAIARNQPALAPVFLGLKETLTVKNMLGINREALLGTIVTTFNRLTHYVTYFFLGTLFSFFILYDLPNLSDRTRSLRHTRFRAVYEETAESVATFAQVVGAAFQAQIIIASVNTALTAAGLWLLHIKPVVLLSVIVFFAGLIPVLGVFVSSIPILLLAFNIQGWVLALKAAALIGAVHAIEAYVLNPNIFSAVLKINPVITLIILYIGHSLFGIWGVLMGVPAAVYVYRHILLSDGDGARRPDDAEDAPQ